MYQPGDAGGTWSNFQSGNRDDVRLEIIDQILLAGAFGSNLRPESLRGIGMLPDIDLDRIKAVGNAAGAGAVMALLSRKQLELATELAQKAEHVELSLNQGFNRKFARAINFANL